MGLFEQFQTDSAKESDGVTITFGKNDDGTEICFQLSRAGKSNKAYVKLLAAKLKPYQRQIDMKTADNDVMDKVLREVFVMSILKGWSNVQDQTGVVIPFNKQNALDLFDKLPDLYEDLDAKSRDLSLFRIDALEDEAKN